MWENPREPTGRPGFRAPHVPIGADRSTLDLFGRDFVVVAGPDGEEWLRAARAAGDACGVSRRGALSRARGRRCLRHRCRRRLARPARRIRRVARERRRRPLRRTSRGGLPASTSRGLTPPTRVPARSLRSRNVRRGLTPGRGLSGLRPLRHQATRGRSGRGSRRPGTSPYACLRRQTRHGAQRSRA